MKYKINKINYRIGKLLSFTRKKLFKVRLNLARLITEVKMLIIFKKTS